MKEKSKLRMIFDWIIIFVLIFLMSAFYFFGLLNIFYKFNVLSTSKYLWSSCIIGMIIAIIVFIYILKDVKSKKKSKFTNWLFQNTHNFILYYVVSYLFFISLRAEIILDLSELKNIISLCWSIFGISITIFLFWDVLILQYLKNKQPKKDKNMSLFQKYWHIEQRRNFYDGASTLFNTITLLTINLGLLIISTSLVYVVDIEISIFNQSIVLLSFYFCTNTIFQLFLDILVPLRADKKLMLKDMKITPEEVELQNEINDKIEKTAIAIGEIEKLNNISDEQKDKIKKELLRDFIEDTSASQVKELCEVTRNDKL